MNHKVSSIHAASNYQLPAANSKMQNEPNLSPAQDSNTPNEPNLRLLQLGPRSKYAKRTQFPYTRCPAAPHFSETNPIPATADLWRTKKSKRLSRRSGAKTETQFPANKYTFYNLQYTIQWPNFHVPLASRQPPRVQICKTNPIPATADLWRTKKSKRTQFTAPAVIPSGGLRSEAQPPKAEGSAKHHRRRRFQTKNPAHTPEMRNEPNGSF